MNLGAKICDCGWMMPTVMIETAHTPTPVTIIARMRCPKCGVGWTAEGQAEPIAEEDYRILTQARGGDA